MIYRDQFGLLVNETLDGMDSCLRAGMMTVFSDNETGIFKYVDPVLTPRRHPFMEPANNPKNFSKDQLIPLMGGLYKLGDTFYTRQIFWKLFRRGFFCFNTERDWPGSKKYSLPHYFYKDSFPTSDTIPFFISDISKVDPYVNGAVLDGRKIKIEWKVFDAPDSLFLSPHVLWFLAKCARLHFIELLLAPIGSIWLFLNVRFHSQNPNDENNQILVVTKTMGQKWVDLYKKHNIAWMIQVFNYWSGRNEVEYYDNIVENY